MTARRIAGDGTAVADRYGVYDPRPHPGGGRVALLRLTSCRSSFTAGASTAAYSGWFLSGVLVSCVLNHRQFATGIENAPAVTRSLVSALTLVTSMVAFLPGTIHNSKIVSSASKAPFQVSCRSMQSLPPSRDFRRCSFAIHCIERFLEIGFSCQ